jgi:hypothetical protein
MTIRSAVAMRLAILFGSTLAMQCASAADLGYVLRGGLTYSDNFDRRPAGEEKGAGAVVASMELDGERTTGRVRYKIEADLSRYQYINARVSGANFGNAMAHGSYELVPDAIRWNADIDYAQQRGDLSRPLSPSNEDQVVHYSTGPTLQTHLFGAFDGLVDARYSRVAYSNTPFDNESVSVQGRLQRRVSPRSMLSIGASHEDISYVGASAFDFKRQEGTAIMNINGIRTRLELEGGIARVYGEFIKDDGPVARARISRRLTPFIDGYVSYRQEYPTSVGANLALNPVVPGGDTFESSIISATPRKSKTAEIGIALNRTRTKADIGFLHSKEDSLSVGIGSRGYDAIHARFTRLMTPSSRSSIYGSVSRDDLSQSARYTEKVFGAEYGLDLSRSIGIDVRIEHRSRGSNGASTRGEYSELGGGVFLRYTGAFGRTLAKPTSGLGR